MPNLVSFNLQIIAHLNDLLIYNKTDIDIVAMSPPDWLHCNFCMKQRCSGLVMTSCGKVVCNTCKPRLQTTQCTSCHGPCNRTVELNSKTPKEVTKLFTDLSSELKSVFKSIDFQANQKRQILLYKKKKLDATSIMSNSVMNYI